MNSLLQVPSDGEENNRGCELCPRRCRVKRVAGAVGYCRAGDRMRIYRYGPHYGEEPPISGSGGSGTVFFSCCTMRCLYCQNYPWSQENAGRLYSVQQLSAILVELRDAGCHNWNLVSPTPWLTPVLEALVAVRARGINLPVVYNTSGYESVDVIRSLAGQVDVYLADLRYARMDSAREGSDTPDYVEKARAALCEMWRQAGPLRLDDDGVAYAGMICRILVLPGRAGEACENLDWLAETFGADLAVSVMGQYVPTYKAPSRAGWDRRITAAEYDMVCRKLQALGFAVGWTQEYDAAMSDDLLGFNMPPDAAKQRG